MQALAVVELIFHRQLLVIISWARLVLIYRHLLHGGQLRLHGGNDQRVIAVHERVVVRPHVVQIRLRRHLRAGTNGLPIAVTA